MMMESIHKKVESFLESIEAFKLGSSIPYRSLVHSFFYGLGCASHADAVIEGLYQNPALDRTLNLAVGVLDNLAHVEETRSHTSYFSDRSKAVGRFALGFGFTEDEVDAIWYQAFNECSSKLKISESARLDQRMIFLNQQNHLSYRVALLFLQKEVSEMYISNSYPLDELATSCFHTLYRFEKQVNWSQRLDGIDAWLADEVIEGCLAGLELVRKIFDGEPSSALSSEEFNERKASFQYFYEKTQMVCFLEKQIIKKMSTKCVTVDECKKNKSL